MPPLFNKNSVAFWSRLENPGLSFQDSLSWSHLGKFLLSYKATLILSVFRVNNVCSAITTRLLHRMTGSLVFQHSVTKKRVSKTERPHTISLSVPILFFLWWSGLAWNLLAKVTFQSSFVQRSDARVTVYTTSYSFYFLFLKKIISFYLFMFVCVYVSLCVCAQTCGCSWKPEEGIRSPEMELHLVSLWC